MAGINLSIDAAKGTFFSAEKVIAAVDKAVAKALSKYGAYVRQRAKSSLKYSKEASAPGQIPHVHKTLSRTKTNKKTGVTKIQPVSPLREFIFFGYDASSQTVVIGPTLFHAAKRKATGGHTVPEIIEKGGSEQAEKVIFLSGRRTVKTHSATYAPRPFMAPAAAAETPKFLASLKDSVK